MIYLQIAIYIFADYQIKSLSRVSLHKLNTLYKKMSPSNVILDQFLFLILLPSKWDTLVGNRPQTTSELQWLEHVLSKTGEILYETS